MIKILKDREGKETALGRDDLERSLLGLDNRIEYLKNQYALYFNGELKLPPEKDRETLEKDILKMNRTESKSPRVNMMVHNISSKFSLYNNMWLKKLNDLESGVSRLPTGLRRFGQPAVPAAGKKPSRIRMEIDLNREESFDALVESCRENFSEREIDDTEKSRIIDTLKTKMIMDNIVLGKAEIEFKNGEFNLKIKE